jgi:hypothetical protein
MRLEVNFLSRKPIKIAGIFEIGDIVLMGLFVFMLPFFGLAYLGIPLYFSWLVCGVPIMIFVLRFRVRRRPGYFMHYVGFKIRARYWTCGYSQRFRLDDFASRALGWSDLPRRPDGKE